jgi:hypothetical protein
MNLLGEKHSKVADPTESRHKIESYLPEKLVGKFLLTDILAVVITMSISQTTENKTAYLL